MDLHQGPGGPRGPGGPPGPQGPHPKRQFFHNKIKNFHFSGQNAQEADPNDQKWRKLAKIGENLRNFPKNLQFLQILILVAQMGTWDRQKSKNQKKRQAFYLLSIIFYHLPNYYLCMHHDVQYTVMMMMIIQSSTVIQWDKVQYVQYMMMMMMMMMMMCCAQHSTAVKSIGSIIAVLPLFLIFARNGWNYHSGAGGITTCRFFWFLVEVEEAPLPLFFAFFDFCTCKVVASTPKIKKIAFFLVFGGLGYP